MNSSSAAALEVREGIWDSFDMISSLMVFVYGYSWVLTLQTGMVRLLDAVLTSYILYHQDEMTADVNGVFFVFLFWPNKQLSQHLKSFFRRSRTRLWHHTTQSRIVVSTEEAVHANRILVRGKMSDGTILLCKQNGQKVPKQVRSNRQLLLVGWWEGAIDFNEKL